MMGSRISMGFEKLDVVPNMSSVNISNCLFDQTPLSRSSELFLHSDVVTQVWGEGSYVGDRVEVYLS